MTSILLYRAMLHDENVHKNPYEFDPDRFAPSTERPEGEPDPAKIAFGFGRRWDALAIFLSLPLLTELCVTSS